MLPIGQVKIGSKIIFRDGPHEVVSANTAQAGRGQAKLDTKLRNLITGAIFEQTFQGNDRIEPAELSYKAATYLYREGDSVQVMLIDNFEQLSVTLTPDRLRFLTDGQPIDLCFWRDQVIDVKLPKKVTLTISYTEPAVAGNTVNTALKPAELENGTKVMVPLFIKPDDRVVVDTETGQYDSRA